MTDESFVWLFLYAVAGLFSFPIWQSESKWGLAAALFPVHSLGFWFLTQLVSGWNAPRAAY